VKYFANEVNHHGVHSFVCPFQIGVSEEDRARYQEIVAAILHIGEIAFVEKV
jgi:hypothetical protein